MSSYKLSPGAAFAVGTTGIAIFSGMDAVMKSATLAIGVYNTMLWRSMAGIVIAGVLWAMFDRGWPTRVALKLHIARGVITSVMAILFFWGLARIPIAQATTLGFTAPIMALFLAALVLRERIARATIVASVVAFAGVLIVLFGQTRSELGPEAAWGAASVLGSAVCYAVNLILMRAQSQVASPLQVGFWQTIVVTIALATAAPWFGTSPPVAQAPLILLAAVLATTSLLLLSWAYAHGEASYLAPTEYTAFVWSALFGWIVFSEVLSPWTLAGATFIIIGCLIAARARPQPQPEPGP